MLTGLEKHLHSAIWASSRIILKLKTSIKIPTHRCNLSKGDVFFSFWYASPHFFLKFYSRKYIQWSCEGNIHQCSELRYGLHIFVHFLPHHSLTSHITNSSLQVKVTFSAIFSMFSESLESTGYSNILNLVIRPKMKESIWSSQLFYFRFNLLENIKSPPPDLHDSPSRD